VIEIRNRHDRLEDRPEASSPLICVRMKPCPQPWLLRLPDFPPSVSSSLPYPHPRRVPPPLSNPAGCLGPVAADGLFFPGAGPGRTGSARIWVSGADNLQREIEWSTPITVPGLFLPSSRLFEDDAVMSKTNRRAALPLVRFVIVITGIDGSLRAGREEDERERMADDDCCSRGLRTRTRRSSFNPDRISNN